MHGGGARTFVANGLINDCGRIVREGKDRMGWFDLSTLKEPYRIEGKKTMGLELAEQLDWQLPDVILYPTGGGTGLIGMWKAFQELAAIGWLKENRFPRMVAVQSTGCSPIVNAFRQGSRFAELHQGAATVASGIRVPAAVGDFMILDAVRESHGCAIAVEEERIGDWMRLAISSEGIAVCPEAAACVGAAIRLREEGWIQPHEHVVLFIPARHKSTWSALVPRCPRLIFSNRSIGIALPIQSMEQRLLDNRYLVTQSADGFAFRDILVAFVADNAFVHHDRNRGSGSQVLLTFLGDDFFVRCGSGEDLFDGSLFKASFGSFRGS